MGIEVVARGSVTGAPVEVTGSQGTATVMVLRDKGAEENVEYEVTCRARGVGEVVRSRVRLGDPLVVVGNFALRAVSAPLEDPVSAARVSLEARIVALDLGAASEAYS